MTWQEKLDWWEQAPPLPAWVDAAVWRDVVDAAPVADVPGILVRLGRALSAEDAAELAADAAIGVEHVSTILRRMAVLP